MIRRLPSIDLTMDDRTASGAYVGRFAPSPSGLLHAGSLVAAIASALDARAHGGRWLLRIEDLDPPREVPGAATQIVAQLRALGLLPDGPVVHQSTRGDRYLAAFESLRARGLVYPCACTRREIADSHTDMGDAPQRNRELVYPGTCRDGIAAGRSPRAWRLRVDAVVVHWQDRLGGRHREDLAREVGDFVLRRADGLWAYQLAVVVDDAEQKVTDVVRGADLLGSTARQIYLQELLGYPRPRYLHLPVVTDAHGEKLSKQTGALPIDTERPVAELNRALSHLGLEPVQTEDPAKFWEEATRRWAASRWMG
jgi:glutamyl-Q tRNA(Asp) synthetase